MSKITLGTVGSITQNPTSAQTTINSNFATIQTAMDNTLSRDGTAPDQMLNNLDMNSQQIINLPAPATGNSPARLQDLATITGGGTVVNIPTGGTVGQALKKNSSTNYDTSWGNVLSSVGLALPADFTVTNSPVTGTGTLTGAWAVTPTGTGAVVRATSPTLVTPVMASIVNTGTLTLPSGSDTLVGRNTVDTLTNKTIDTAGPNTLKLNGNTLTAGAGSGTLTLPSGTHTIPALDTTNAYTAAQSVTSNTNPQLTVQTSSGDNATVDVLGATNRVQLGETSTENFVKGVSNAPLGLWTNNTERFTISAAGGLFAAGATGGDKGINTGNFSAVYQNGNQVNYPAFQVNRTATQTLTASVAAKINFDTKVFDTNSYFDNTTNFRFTPLVAGKYMIILSGQVTATWTSGQFMNLIIEKNSSAVLGGVASTYPPTGAGAMIQSLSTIVTLNGSTDFIEGWVNSSGGGTLQLVGGASNTSMAGYYLGP